MAEEKKVTEVKAEEKKEAREEIRSVKDSGLNFVDSYEARRVDEEGEDIVEKSNVIYTNVRVDHLSGKSATSGRIWHDLSTSWNHKITGRDGKEKIAPLTIRYVPRKSFEEKYVGKSMHELIGLICGDEKFVYLDIVRNERINRDTGAKVVTYSPRISYTDPNGVELVCPLSLYGESDRVTWDLLIGTLKAAEVIS